MADLFRLSGTSDGVKDNIPRAQAAIHAHRGSKFQVATTKEAMKSLWAARKEALWAMLAVRPEGTQIWSTDVAVPLSHLAEIIGMSKHHLSQRRGY